MPTFERVHSFETVALTDGGALERVDPAGRDDLEPGEGPAFLAETKNPTGGGGIRPLGASNQVSAEFEAMSLAAAGQPGTVVSVLERRGRLDGRDVFERGVGFVLTAR